MGVGISGQGVCMSKGVGTHFPQTCDRRVVGTYPYMIGYIHPHPGHGIQWDAFGKHPTGMLSCIYYKLKNPHHETYFLLLLKYIIRIV